MKKSQFGFALLESFMILVILAILAGTSYYVLNSRAKTDDSLKNSSQISSNTPVVISKPKPVSLKSDCTLSADGKYIELKQWDVRFTVGILSGAICSVKDEHTAYFSSSNYVEEVGGDSCLDNGSTGQIERGLAGYVPGSGNASIDKLSVSYSDNSGETITNSSIKVGDYYFWWAGPQAPCANPDTYSSAMNKYQSALRDLANSVQAL